MLRYSSHTQIKRTKKIGVHNESDEPDAYNTRMFVLGQLKHMHK